MLHSYAFYLHLWGHKIVWMIKSTTQFAVPQQMKFAGNNKVGPNVRKDCKVAQNSLAGFVIQLSLLQLKHCKYLEGLNYAACFSFSIFFHLHPLLLPLLLHFSVLRSSCPPSPRFPSSRPLSLEQICLAFQSSRPGVVKDCKASSRSAGREGTDVSDSWALQHGAAMNLHKGCRTNSQIF